MWQWDFATRYGNVTLTEAQAMDEGELMAHCRNWAKMLELEGEGKVTPPVPVG